MLSCICSKHHSSKDRNDEEVKKKKKSLVVGPSTSPENQPFSNTDYFPMISGGSTKIDSYLNPLQTKSDKISSN